MNTTRRTFMKNGVAAFTVSFAAPTFLSELAQAQGGASRNLVVLYLGGGNDSLSMVMPYTDPYYNGARAAARTSPFPRLTRCRSAPTPSGKAIGLHPRLNGSPA